MLTATSAMADASKLTSEAGYQRGEGETARSVALAGATRALGTGTSGVYANPATMAMTRVYHLEGTAAFWPEAKRQSFGAAAVDSVTSRLAGGLSAHFDNLDSDGIARKWTDLRFALAYPFSERFFAGATGRYLKLRQNGLGPLGPSVASSGRAGDPIVDAITFDAGIALKPTDSLSFGVVGSNLTNLGNGLVPMTVGGGAGFGTSDVTLEGNVIADFSTFTNRNGAARTTLRGELGGEYLVADHYPIRLGYRYDDGLQTHSMSAGLGFIEKQFAIEVGARRAVAGPGSASPSTTIIVGIQVFLESSGLTREPGDQE